MNNNIAPRTKATYPEETKEFWFEHFTNMEASSLSKVAYCRRHSLNYDRMQYWRKQLIGAQAKKLLPVTIKEKSPKAKSPLTQPNTLAQLHLGNGINISITSHDAYSLLLNKVLSHAVVI